MPTIYRTMLTTLLLMNLSLAADQAASDPALKAYDLRLAGKTDEAKALLEEATKKNPKDARAWFELARTCWQQWPVKHDFKGAARAIDRACKLAPKENRYWLWAGYIHTYNSVAKAHNVFSWAGVPGEMVTGAKYAQKALDLDPTCSAARYMLYCLYNNNPWYLGGSSRKAKALLKNAQAKDPVGTALIEANKIPRDQQQKRLDLWLALLQTRPADPNVHKEIMTIASRMDDYALAREHAERICQLAPARRFCLLELARNVLRKDPALAEELVNQYLAATDTPITLQAHAKGLLAKIRSRQGRAQEADELKAQARAMDPYTWQDLPDALDLFTARP